MKKFVMILSMLLSLGATSMAFAITLDEAKAQGLVGEKVDGYIAAVPASVSAEVEELIRTTNAGRERVYGELAQRNGITVEQVGIVSAEKLRDQAKRGEYVQSASGAWQRE